MFFKMLFTKQCELDLFRSYDKRDIKTLREAIRGLRDYD